MESASSLSASEQPASRDPRRQFQDGVSDPSTTAPQLRALGVRCRTLLQNTEDIETLDAALRWAEFGSSMIPEHPDKIAYHLHYLGDNYGYKYQQTKAPEHLEVAIQLLQEALDLTPECQPDHAARLHSLGTALGIKYYLTMKEEDLKHSVHLFQDAIDQTPQDHPDRVSRLFALGAGYRDLFTITTSLQDLNKGVPLLEEALEQTSLDHPHRLIRLRTIGSAYLWRYRQTGVLKDANLAVEHFRQSLDAGPSNQLDTAPLLCDLGVGYRDRFWTSFKRDDIETAIPLLQKALKYTPESNVLFAFRAQALGIAHSFRGALEIEPADFELSVRYHEKALKLAPSKDRDRASHLQSLGGVYKHKYSELGTSEDLDTAIRIYHESLDLTPAEDLDRVSRLSCLANAYLARSSTGSIRDCDAAIDLFKNAYALVPQKKHIFSTQAQSLGRAYEARFIRTGDEKDLEYAITFTHEALEHSPIDHPFREFRFRGLVVLYKHKHHRTQMPEYLKLMFSYSQEALKSTALNTSAKASGQCLLGICHACRYLSTKVSTDIQAAIDLFKESLESTSVDDPARAWNLNLLGTAYMDRYKNTADKGDLNLAILTFQESLDHTRAALRDRLEAGVYLTWLLSEAKDWVAGFRAAHTTIHLIQLLAPRYFEIVDKQHLLSRITGLGQVAATIALNAGKSPFEALELLEIGRGVIAGSLNEIRADISNLQSQIPELGNEYVKLSRQLDSPSLDEQLAFVEENGLSFTLGSQMGSRASTALLDSSQNERCKSYWQGRENQRRDAGQKLESLIQKIREHPGFEDFLLGPTEKQLREAARHGIIIVVNVSRLGSDAIIIDEHQIQTLALPGLAIQEVKRRAQEHDLGSPTILKWLWESLTQPILQKLGFNQSRRDASLPRVWWIPTGTLSKFPLHAAGLHGEMRGETVIDRVMSSYSTSVKAIIHRRSKESTQLMPPTTVHALLVAMQDTPRHKTLPFALEEVETLRRLFGTMAITPVEPTQSKADVLQHLLYCQIFHFAGHGFTDGRDPSQSRLLLTDWEISPLTVDDLLKMNLRKHSPFLAYLSACGTGQIQHAGIVDESIHMISAFQLAGFRNVIGTLWEVDDKVCVEIARISYEEMGKLCPDSRFTDRSVCWGLHRATIELRDRWLQSAVGTRKLSESPFKPGLCLVEKEANGRIANGGGKPGERLGRDVVSCDDDDKDEDDENDNDVAGSLSWVPYLHYGV